MVGVGRFWELSAPGTGSSRSLPETPMPAISFDRPGQPVKPAASRCAVVLNHSAGALVGQADVTQAIAAAFEAHGLAAEIIQPDAGTLPERVALACASGAQTVVVVGGDGTVACAAAALADTGIALGILPSGTMNLLARDLGLPIGNLDAAVAVLARGEMRTIDVGSVNGHVFLCGSMIGLPTRLAQVREAGRGKPFLLLWGRFLRAALRLLYGYRPMRLAITAGGKRFDLRTPSVTVTVGRLSDDTGRQFGRAVLDAGVFGIYAFRRLRLFDAMRIGLLSVFGRWQDDEAVLEMEGPAVSIASRRPAMRVMNDGEAMLLQTPLAYTLRPRALLVVAGA